ncbi:MULTISPECIES: TetR/AcrR family transcriptional regulator [unclassified Mycolicibacterium]|uniref:TetR/AcrR family transcriptional regulator n=1 Tax=unclassified Mycolicibacterium TaxID=2636767 RepID=UPI0012DDA935|nr:MULTISPECIES: TetR/AcrR family transcriptional regulator [unclassified Mycolicibacterium]MUL83245.1 helix-turn-helix transcriptional regulator [Mycolicibacterium sp. CBMA 329]MUL89580.1 helix-turn-helix transcriptional regulator [Mycolicibacterium sp. CBMA 331]MUM02664.1 helix-turn-helix transcriptional regulator [Mycolicibacterium sp. CBMA 334]MUM28695.1 helix-turn-helix transcriptional regulator [Mycolicibacterium sp. CBMA 295]MUM39096.1 helix-turn-helix transcriptional regulator [Mycolic
MSESAHPFTRARSEAQRQDRLSQLMAATRERLDHTRAATLTLGDVAAAAGLAKSGILRYVGSREALLLRVMYDEHLTWIDALAHELRTATPATALAHTLAAQPVLCDLIAASPVLINRLGPEDLRVLVAQAEDVQQRLGAALGPSLPLSDVQLRSLTAAIHAFTGTAWAWTTPSSAGRDTMVTDFESTVGRLLDIFIVGLQRVDASAAPERR